MARTEWNKQQLTVLKSLGLTDKLNDAPQLLGCTANAARIKYGRMFGVRKAASIYNKMYPVTHTDAFKSKVDNTISVNPFVIEQVPFTGVKSTPEIVLMLAKQMLSINANKLDSIYIPTSIADSKKSANNIFQQAKNYIAKTNQAELVYTIKSTFSGDADKKYLSGRIWRLK
jgi:hypothetical protein